MKKPTNQASTESGTVSSTQPSLTPQEKERLQAALDTARENVKPTVQRLKESEAVSNELLSMRLELLHFHEPGEN